VGGTDIPRVTRALHMNCWKLILEYDGTNYSGWQEQKNSRTIAGEIRKAAEKVIDTEINLDAAGRTDSGVHALHQVARIQSKKNCNVNQLAAALNRELPKDIHILDVSNVSSQFHPRHDAKQRSYLYQIALRRTAFAKRYVWWIHELLNLDRMKAACKLFVGRHDFERFADKRSEEKSTIVVVDQIEAERFEDLFLIRITASHFLWKMVRRMVGCLVQTGLNQLTEEHLAAFLSPQPVPRKLRSFSVAAHTAPASGLFLEFVSYRKEDHPGPLQPAFRVRKI
jgi:tRNA pseudouridine38-40 synthase